MWESVWKWSNAHPSYHKTEDEAAPGASVSSVIGTPGSKKKGNDPKFIFLGSYVSFTYHLGPFEEIFCCHGSKGRHEPIMQKKKKTCLLGWIFSTARTLFGVEQYLRTENKTHFENGPKTLNKDLA